MTPYNSSLPSSQNVEQNEMQENLLSVRPKASHIEKFVRVATRWSAAGALAFGAFLSLGDSSHGIEHHAISSSAPHRTIGCETGTGQPFAKAFGHFRPSWRRWPTATEYSGVKKPSPNIAIPDAKIPDAREELRFEPRTRSDRPLDPEPGEQTSENVPPTGSNSDPNNPFEAVPETDLPDTGAATDPLIPPPTNGGTAAPNPMDALPSGMPDASGDIFGMPDTDPVPGTPTGGFEPTPTPNNEESSPLPDLDNGSDELPSTNDEFNPFDFGNRLRRPQPSSPRQAQMTDREELEFLREELRRRNMLSAQEYGDQSMKEQIMDQLAADPIPQVTGTTTELPKFEVTGNFSGEFAADDLVARPIRTDSRVAPAVMEQVEATASTSSRSEQYIQDHELLRRQIQELREQLQKSGISGSTQSPPYTEQRVRLPSNTNQAASQRTQKAQSAPGIVYEDTGNPLRPRTRMMGSANVEAGPSRSITTRPNASQSLALRNKSAQTTVPASTTTSGIQQRLGNIRQPLQSAEANLNDDHRFTVAPKPATGAFIRTSTQPGGVPSILQTKRREQQRQRNAAAARASTIKTANDSASHPIQPPQPETTAIPEDISSAEQSTVRMRSASEEETLSASDSADGDMAVSDQQEQHVGKSKPNIDPKRNIAATHRRSLRDTLRKKPLRH